MPWMLPPYEKQDFITVPLMPPFVPIPPHREGESMEQFMERVQEMARPQPSLGDRLKAVEQRLADMEKENAALRKRVAELERPSDPGLLTEEEEAWLASRGQCALSRVMEVHEAQEVRGRMEADGDPRLLGLAYVTRGGKRMAVVAGLSEDV